MTAAEYLQLSCGSVLRWNMPTGIVLRTVIIGPQDHVTPHVRDGVVLPILHHSWTRRAYTVYSFADTYIKLAEVHTKRAKELVSGFELGRLLNWCKPSEKIEREIREGAFSNCWNPLRDREGLCMKLHRLRRDLKWASI